eukprot:gb/GECG01008020.1/.p1 GENE.gb/GECG01008020.1/~~gb/GECG01008020.1/.p1  ORF type:complete len:921 (+),score=174.17 gb/GECG01008020.1/:1-2763(+)
MAQGYAVVKSVIGGDSLVLMGRGNPPPEMQVSLASLQAPRLARHPNATDEPFAWQSREFLRKMLIGQSVQFKIQYKVDSINRQFADIWLNGESVSKKVVENGWAKVVPIEMTKHGRSADYEELQQLNAKAEEEKKGIYNDNSEAVKGAIRKVLWNVPEDRELLNQLQNSPQSAVVEQVKDGASLRCILTGLKEYMLVINFNLAGVQSPRYMQQQQQSEEEQNTNSGGAETTTVAQPFAGPAKLFTETRLLNRDVVLHIGGADKFNNFFGKVEHPAGDISAELLKNGLGRMVDWSIRFTDPSHASTMRNAENAAKNGKLNIWKEWEPQQISGDSEYTGKVTEIVSGDTIIVQVKRGSATEERRVQLSSIRAPRVGKRDEEGEPWSWEAKDLLRRTIVGKEVEVVVDYTRPPAQNAPTNEERRFVTVYATNKKGEKYNVAAILVSEGYAEVVRHRVDDPKSSQYDELLQAENRAKESGKGMQGKKPAPKHRLTNLTMDTQKAKNFFPFLQRAGKMRAIVDYVVSGGRVKLIIPSENCICMFAISGVRCPTVAKPSTKGPDGKQRPGRQAEPFGDEAYSFMRENTLQREVEIEVDTIDQRGTILGSLFVGSGGQRQNVGVALLQKGYGSIIPAAARNSPYADELFEAEEEARTAKRGVWTHVAEKEEAEEAAHESQQFIQLRVCDVLDGNCFFVHAQDDMENLRKVEEEMRQMKEEHGETHAVVDPRRGKVVAALFDDGSGLSWFRARIDGKGSGRDEYAVTYIDYGNRGSVPLTKMRPLPSSHLEKLPPLARGCRLAFVKSPQLDEEFGREAGICLSESSFGKDLVAKIHSRDDDNRLVVTLFDENSPMSVNEKMIQEGVARLSKREIRSTKNAARRQPDAEALQKDLKIIESLEAAQNEVSKKRINIWRYGDVADSDVEDV